MTDTIDAPRVARDQPAPLDLPSAAPLPPPTSGGPMPTQPPPPPGAPVPPPPPAAGPAPVTTGPSAIFSAEAPVIPVDHAAPILQTIAPAVPSAQTITPAAPNVPTDTPAETATPIVPTITPSVPIVPTTPRPAPASVFDVQEFIGTQSTTKKSPAKRKRRWLVRLVMLGLLGAGGWAGTQYGPALYDEYVRQNDPAVSPEATAPLAFPNVATVSTPIRTAEFVLAGLPETPGAIYRVTTDFETSVSQVDITRTSGPELQVLTYGDDAMIRRADGQQWYLLDRGQFPLDGRLERSDWVRRIDELLPSEIRNRAAIESSTESSISGVPTRRLALTIDPSLLGTVTTDDAVAVEQPAEAVPATADAPSAAPTPAPAPAPAAIRIEVWIDGEGLVRQVTGAPQLGADTITVVSTSAESWIPDYPQASAIAPLTASALVDLGL